MKQVINYGLIIICVLSLNHCIKRSDSILLEDPYLGQKSPSMIPEIFAPNLISKGYHELGITISNDNHEIFYIMSDRNYQHYSLINMKKINNSWTKPEIADFALDKSVYTCFFSPDDKGLYFSTNRSVVVNVDTLKGVNNWFVEKKESKWQEPKLINEYFDKGKSYRIQSISELKNIYLTRKVSNGNTNIFVSRFIDGKFLSPQPINGFINSEYDEGRPFIAPDESYLIFQSDRPGGFGSNDLWISYCESGIWEEPINLGNQINTEASEFAPYISPDGKYLFFSSYRSLKKTEIIDKNYDELIDLYGSSRNGYATLYRMSSEIIESLNGCDTL